MPKISPITPAAPTAAPRYLIAPLVKTAMTTPAIIAATDIADNISPPAPFLSFAAGASATFLLADKRACFSRSFSAAHSKSFKTAPVSAFANFGFTFFSFSAISALSRSDSDVKADVSAMCFCADESSLSCGTPFAKVRV